jgi:prepilin-type processing-associated H-X9-DG protein
MSKRIKCVAFTLIEMLVVIGVIMILAAILMPTLSRAKESGRVARCASNLRQLHLAAMNYANDSGGTLPVAVSSWVPNGDGTYTLRKGWVHWVGGLTAPTPGSYDWQGSNGTVCITNGTLWPYVGAIDVYLCPTFASRGVCGSTTPRRSYSMPTNTASVVSGGNILSVQATKSILFGDDGNIIATFDSQFGTIEIGKWHTATGGVRGGQVVFLDGHVEKR